MKKNHQRLPNHRNHSRISACHLHCFEVKPSKDPAKRNRLSVAEVRLSLDIAMAM